MSLSKKTCSGFLLFIRQLGDVAKKHFLTFILILVTATLALDAVQNYSLFQPKLFIALIVATVLSFSFGLFFENQSFKGQKGLILSLVVITISSAIIWFSYDINVTAGLMVPFAVLSLLVLPVLGKTGEQTPLCHYYSNLGFKALATVLVSVIFGLSFSAFFASLFYLFDQNVSALHGHVYGYIWVLAGFLLFPLFFLYNFSIQDNWREEQTEFSRALIFIVTYILAPITLLYALLLYAYIVKDIVIEDVSKEQLTYIIIGYGAAGMITQLFASSLVEQKQSSTPLLVLISRYFYPLFLIPAVYLGAFIAGRISDFGVTEARYAVALFALWFVGSALYMSISARKSPLMLLLAAMGILFTVSFGPWSVAQLSVYSQKTRLVSLLEQNSLIKDGKYQRAKHPFDVNFENTKSISSILSYFSEKQRNDALQDVLPKSQYSFFHRDFLERELGIVQLYSYSDRDEYGSAAQTLSWRLQQGTPVQEPQIPKKYFAFKAENLSLNLAGFAHYINTIDHDYNGHPLNRQDSQIYDSKDGFAVNISDTSIRILTYPKGSISFYAQEIMQFDLSEIARGLLPHHHSRMNPTLLGSSHLPLLVFQKDSQDYKVMLVVNKLKGYQKAEELILDEVAFSIAYAQK